MKRIGVFFQAVFTGILAAVSRFPMTSAALTGAAGLICYMFWLEDEPPVMIYKLMLTLLVAAVLGMAVQFAMERFERKPKFRGGAYALAALLSGGYFGLLWPASKINLEIGIRTTVAVFALICLTLWLPALRAKTNFNEVALIHFKSLFTSVLYAAVLTAGLAAILGAIDILLTDVDERVYFYMITIVWVIFATMYYLSLLPVFSASDESGGEEGGKDYPRILEILVSYIAIPLIGAYTLVLAAYFIKMLATLSWPSGQLGPMVLAYSAAGLIIYVLAGMPQNRFAKLYCKIFPKALIPAVIMQLISVFIRLRAYGVTESRYYVALFGIFSLAIGILLSFKPRQNNALIALLAAVFAIVSVIPPVDAFSVSKNSQIGRLESILLSEGVLVGDTLVPQSDVSRQDQYEVTNILDYLSSRGYSEGIVWLPANFDRYENMESVFGFGPVYNISDELPGSYYYLSLDMQEPVPVTGYDMAFNLYSYQYEEGQAENQFSFTVRGTEYTMTVRRQSETEVVISVSDGAGNKLVETGLYDFALSISAPVENRQTLPVEDMTLETQQNGYKLKIVLQSFSMTETDGNPGAEYSFTALFGAP